MIEPTIEAGTDPGVGTKQPLGPVASEDGTEQSTSTQQHSTHANKNQKCEKIWTLPRISQPLTQILGNELGTIVRTDVFRDSVLDPGVGQRFDHVAAVQLPLRANHNTLASKLIDRILLLSSFSRLAWSILQE